MFDVTKYPAIISTEASPKVSDRYSFVSTSEVIQLFEAEGWRVRTASQVKSSKQDPRYAAHQVIFAKDDLMRVGDTAPEIVVGNSHNGQKPLDIMVGLFRLVCGNGLRVPMGKLSEQFKIRHIGITRDDVKALTQKLDANLSGVSERVKRMMETQMTREQSIEFLRQSSVIKFDAGVEINYDDFLTAQRVEDGMNTVWSVFNIAQERIMGGDFKATKGGKVRKAKPIKSFLKANEINVKLWEAAEAFCN